jgi:hypothetical protein
MNERKIKVTADQVDRLLSDVRASQTAPIGDHLSDDESIGYAMGSLTADEVQRVDEHLASCPDCAAEAERLLSASDVWSGQQGASRLASLQGRVRKEIETEVVPEMDRPISLSERLRGLVARLVGRRRGARAIEQKVQVRVWQPAFARGERVDTARLQKLIVQNAGETSRFLTVLDEDEAGELYLFLSIYESASGERKGPVYCWPVESTQVELPFIPDLTERHRYQVYLTDREVPVPEGVLLDLNINDEERSEERGRLIAAFLEALERGEIGYRAVEQEVRP